MSAWEMKEEYKEIFLEESEDQLREWEEGLLELEKSPDNKEIIDKIFRAIHTLKGSAGFVGFEDLQKLAHDLESGLQEVRDGTKRLTPEIIEILFEGLDLCQKLISAFADGKDAGVDIDEFLGRVEKVVSGVEKSKEEKSQVKDQTPKKEIVEETPEESPSEEASSSKKEKEHGDYRHRYAVDIKIEASSREAYLRAILVQSRLEDIGKILSVNPPIEELMNMGDEFRFIVTIASDSSAEEVRKAADIDQVNVLEVKEVSGKAPVEENRVTGEADNEPEEKLPEEEKEGKKKVKKASPAERTSRTSEVVRVPVEKLDVMLNLVGELVVQNSGFISISRRLKDEFGRLPLVAELEGKTENLAKIARDLQDAVMKVRMLPVESVFTRFYRVVRDLARVRNKQIELEISGEETEIDKKIIDRIGEPLVHLVRNAVDHGIETPEERKKAGKDPVGHIKLSAYQEGDHICVEVSDDGRGMDREKILEKAFEKGLIKANEAEKMSNEEVYKLIFMPGFSTAKEITDISGRGVGLDVVKSTMEEMGGEVRVSSSKGIGTTFVLILPLTMAIISAIMVEVGNSLFAVPLSNVKEVIKVSSSEFIKLHQNRVIRIRDEVVSVVYLGELLNFVENMSFESGGINDIPIIVVNYSSMSVGVAVDKLIGKEEIVIKSLSKHYKEIEGLAGASILGDGRIALILDIDSLIKSYHGIDAVEAAYRKAMREAGKVMVEEVEHPVRPAGKDQSEISITEVKEEQNKAGEEDSETFSKGTRIEQNVPEELEVKEKDEKPKAVREEGREQLLKEEKKAEHEAVESEEIDYSEKQTQEKGPGGSETRPETDVADTETPGKSGEEEGEGGFVVEKIDFDDGSEIVIGTFGAEEDENIILDSRHKEMIEEVNTNGAVTASISMTQLLGREVRVSFPDTRLISITEIGQELGGEEKPVSGIYVGIEGDIDGGMLIVLPMEQALYFSDLLFRREPGTTEELGDDEKSALAEMTNILSASFINSIADLTGLSVMSEVPEISIDMCQSVIDSVLAKFNRVGSKILLTQAEIYLSEEEQTICHMLLFLEDESLTKLIEALSTNKYKV